MTGAEPYATSDPLAQKQLTAQILSRVAADTDGNPAAVLDHEALDLGQQLWEAVGGGKHEVPAEAVAVLGALHWLRYLRLPQDTDSADLETALLFYSWISEFYPEVVPRRINALVEATQAAQSNPRDMMKRAITFLAQAKKKSDEIASVDTAVDIIRRVRLSVPPGHPARYSVQEILATALYLRSERTGRLADIHAAVDAARDSIPPEEADDDGSHQMARSNLGTALTARYERTGELADIAEAIQLARTVATDCNEADPSFGMFLSNLSGRACTLYEITGEPALLEEAAEVGRRAVLRSSGSQRSDSLSALGNLAGALKARFELFHQRSDLDEAIEIAGQAVHVCPLGHSDRRTHLANHIDLLTMRAGPGDLDAAVATGRLLLAITPVGHPARPQAAATVGLALRTRHTSTGHLGDLDDGIALEREALEAVATEHPRWAALSANMAQALGERFAVQGLRSDLDEAFGFAEAAVAATSEGDPYQTRRMQVLAELLETRSAASIDAGKDIGEALRLWDESSRIPASPVRMRIRSAIRGGMWAMTEVAGLEQALSCYTQAVSLLDRLAWRGLERAEQEWALAEWAGVAAEAVAVALSCGKAEAGIRLAEQGRAVLWSQLLNARTGLAELRERAPELVDQLSRISSELS